MRQFYETILNKIQKSYKRHNSRAARAWRKLKQIGKKKKSNEEFLSSSDVEVYSDKFN